MISERVQQGALQMGIALPPEAAERFALYHALLVEGNARMNLTTVLEPEEAVDRHFLDSLAPVALGLLPQGARAVDVGTGAGFPGIPLLIARPDLRLTLVDSLNKRLEFLRDVLNRLGLSAEIVHMRAEDFSHQAAHREQYDVAMARALASLSPLMEYLLPCVRREGVAICWKGPGVEEEAAAARRALFLLGGKAREPLPYAIPHRNDWKHNLFLVDKVRPTPKTYPRKAGTPTRNPL